MNPTVPPHVPSLSDESVSRRAEELAGEFARQRRVSVARRRASGTVAVIALLSGVLLSVFGGATAPSASAGWTPIPGAPTPAQLRTAFGDCPAKSLISHEPLVQDERGGFTMLVFVAHGRSSMCIAGPGATLIGLGQGLPPAPGPYSIAIGAGGTEGLSGHRSGFLTGRAGSQVISVVLTLENGERVTATTEHGWYAAWWPSPLVARSALVVTTRGRKFYKIGEDTSLGKP